MTEAKHTPGPWEASGTYIVASTGDRIAYMANRDEQAKADAILIAVAPELLVALQRFLEWDWENIAYEMGGFDEIVENVDIAEAAIAKATGKTK